jgi:tRNA dimethylallyltransferase
MTAERPHPTVAIGGPTATGKTVLAVEVARRIGAELVNADSRQVVRRLVAGTARPTAAELRGVPCHLLDLCEPGEPFTVADWLPRARAVIADLDTRGVPAIVVGGTGQYVRALREGWDLGGVAPSAELRAELDALAATPAGLALLVAELHDRDPHGTATLDVANPRRVIRAVELLRGRAGSRTARRQSRDGRDLTLVALDADRAVHRAALAARLDAMFDTGAILTEVRAELDRGTGPGALRRAGIGYAEAVEVVGGVTELGQAKARAAHRTARYVKAQRTWFRHEPAALRLERVAATTTANLAAAVLAVVPTPGGSLR